MEIKPTPEQLAKLPTESIKPESEETHTNTEDTNMDSPMNIFAEMPWAFGCGNRGYNGNGEGCVTPALLSASFGHLNESQNNSTLLTQLADIKAAIPLAEAQVQLALAGSQSDITSQFNAGFNATHNQMNQAVMTLVQGQFGIREAVTTAATAGVLATRDEGDKTRLAIAALASEISANNIATLNRQLATAESALIEQRAIGRAREVEVNVTQTVNQQQAQAQFQAQVQGLASAVNALVANNQEVRQGIINLGTMVGNAQTAANTKVN